MKDSQQENPYESPNTAISAPPRDLSARSLKEQNTFHRRGVLTCIVALGYWLVLLPYWWTNLSPIATTLLGLTLCAGLVFFFPRWLRARKQLEGLRDLRVPNLESVPAGEDM